MDVYVGNVLSELAKGNKIPYPSKEYSNIRVAHYPQDVFDKVREYDKKHNQNHEGMLHRFKDYKISKEEIDERFKDIVMLVRPSMLYVLKLLNNLNGGTFIYSMWNGYKEQQKTKDFIDFFAGRGMTLKDIHTSGHADSAALKRMVSALKPKKIVPIHTFAPAEYAGIFGEANVQIVNDGEVVEIIAAARR
jgi:ribonuclease J